MGYGGLPAREPLGALLGQLRDLIQAQAEALSAEDFGALDRFDAARTQLVAALGRYTPSDVRPEHQALLDQIVALDQRLAAVARESLERTARELREVRRGRSALQAYRRRGQAPTGGLGRLDREG